MKTIVRVTAILPDCYIRIQRLYDSGKTFQLEEEIKTGHEAADFIDRLLAQGGRKTSSHEFIDDDDFQKKVSATFEYIAP
jgi:hypothetical protein